MERQNVIKDKSYAFAVSVTKFCMWLMNDRKEYVISKQLLKSGTSVGANVEEAQEAQSIADFISKMSIALKEACETRFWLRLICDSDIVSREKIQHLLLQINEIIPLLKTIVKSSKNTAKV